MDFDFLFLCKMSKRSKLMRLSVTRHYPNRPPRHFKINPAKCTVKATSSGREIVNEQVAQNDLMQDHEEQTGKIFHKQHLYPVSICRVLFSSSEIKDQLLGLFWGAVCVHVCIF